MASPTAPPERAAHGDRHRLRRLRLYALGKASFLVSVASHPRPSVEAERLVTDSLPARLAL